MGKYYMTSKGAKTYKRSLIGQFASEEKAEVLARKARKGGLKGVEVIKGKRGKAWGKEHVVYRVYIRR